MILKRLLPLMALIPGTLACAAAGDAPADEGVRLDTIGGIVHVINSGAGLWASGGRWHVHPNRMVEIGEVDGADPYVFGDVTGVLVNEDGRIYIADTQALEVRIFSPEGEFVSRFGRSGDGPGEMRNISGLGWAPGGGVTVLDGRLSRVSIFDATGKFSNSFRLERPYMIFGRGALVRFDAKGHFYDRTALSHGIGSDSIGIVRYAASGQVEDTILVAVYAPPRVLVQRGGVPVMSFSVPFAPEPSSTAGPDGRIYSTRGEIYSIASLAPSGDTLLVIQRAVIPPVVTAMERDSALTMIQERHRQTTGADPRDLPTIPKRKAAVAALRSDELGYLWVLRSSEYGATAMEWDVFNPEGRFLGTLTLPSMDVMYIGERAIAGIIRDELGVARVMVIPLDREDRLR